MSLIVSTILQRRCRSDSASTATAHRNCPRVDEDNCKPAVVFGAFLLFALFVEPKDSPKGINSGKAEVALIRASSASLKLVLYRGRLPSACLLASGLAWLTACQPATHASGDMLLNVGTFPASFHRSAGSNSPDCKLEKSILFFQINYHGARFILPAFDFQNVTEADGVITSAAIAVTPQAAKLHDHHRRVGGVTVAELDYIIFSIFQTLFPVRRLAAILRSLRSRCNLGEEFAVQIQM